MTDGLHHHAILFRSNAVDISDVSAYIGDTQSVNSAFDSFGIDEARALTIDAHNLPSQATVQTFVIRTHFVTLEAQNALLKVIEEPPQSTRFVFVIPKDFLVLSTIESRCVSINEDGVVKVDTLFTTFLGAGLKERIVAIEEAHKKKDVQWQRAIKNGLAEYVKLHPKYAAELEYVVRLLLTRGASNKMLLEHAALTLPTRSKM